MALATQTQVEQILQIDMDDPADVVVAQLIEWADQAVITYIGFDPQAHAGTVENHDGTGSPELYLDRPPIDTITSVVLNGVTLTEGVDNDFVVYPEAGYLLRRGGRIWTAKPRSIVVTYDGGWATVPPDIVVASAQVAARMFQAGAAALPEGAEGIRQINLAGSDSVTFTDTAQNVTVTPTITDNERVLLDPYRRRTVGV